MATTIDLTWQLHLYRHGTAFVQAWQMQLCMHGNPGVALHLSKAWQMQLSMNGNCTPVQIMANAIVQAWQLYLSKAWQMQLSMNGNCTCPNHGKCSCPGIATAFVLSSFF
jgi:hypothetical protein